MLISSHDRKRAPMTQPLRIGLIGAGMVSRHHLLAWAKLKDEAHVVAVADPSPENAGRRAEEFGIPASFRDAQTMLAGAELDAVDIAAPRALHASLVRLAANKGLPVLCQKPLGVDLAEATQLAADVKDRIRLMVHENWRFRGYYRDAAAWLRAGRIGSIKQAQLTLLTSGFLPGVDGLRLALQRQPFMQNETRLLVAEVLIHHLDTLRMLLGPLQVIAAGLSRSCADLAGEDGAVIQLKAHTGANVTVFASFAASGFPATQIDRLDVLGDQGSIRLDGASLTCSGADPAQRSYDLAVEYQGSYNRTIAHFVQALRDGTPFETAPDDNLETLKLVEDCYRLSGWGDR
jgi:D-apiose dehydrogenase